MAKVAVSIAELVGNLPANGRLGEDGLCCDLTGGGAGHVREGILDVVAECPDGNFLHGVAVGDGCFFESFVDGEWGGTLDAGDFAVTVAEAGCVASSGWSNGVATDVDTRLDGLVE